MSTLSAGPSCRFCGASPAIDTTVRGHQGFLIVMRFLKQPGPYCRDCGIATVRAMSAKSLWQGWLTFLSVAVNPLTLLWNLVVRIRLHRLPPIQRPGFAHPMETGKPLYLRLGMLGLLIPLAVLGWLLYNKFVVHEIDGTGARSGACVATSSERLTVVVPCDDADADYRVVGRLENTKDAGGCSSYPGSTRTFTETRRSTTYVLCLEPVAAP
ncbi:hypothetical protein TPB0596_44520 [Tsukamurella pulmonis]|uniref:LppU/SCO3897 family protein n=1 Tax=Tsukamurella pulmonis TaxID=47312 RepID=UPI001EDE38DE|nr:hypothetical protein [Tsukamurella pulmonis]BDD84689.1 hypothetical protein TPB0596_44520 [Tsukamurella pulmonis]